MHAERLVETAGYHGYDESTFAFEKLVLYALCHIQPPALVPIPEDLCLAVQIPPGENRFDIGLRPVARFKAQWEFPSFVGLYSRTPQEGHFKWMDGVFEECTRLYRKLDDANLVATTAKIAEEEALVLSPYVFF